MLRTVRYRIYPTKAQQENIQRTLEICRWLYNLALEQRIVIYRQQKRHVTYTMQQNELPLLKKEYPFFKEVYSQVLQDVCNRLDTAFQGFFRRLKNKEKAGFPRFKGKNRYRSFTYTQSGFQLIKNRIKCSKIGSIRLKQHQVPKGTIKTCTVIHKNGKYYVSLVYEVEQQPCPRTNRMVGVDVGIEFLATTSDGQFFENAKHLRKSEKHLKRLQRIVSKRKKGSNRRRKAVRLLAKVHERIANQRKDTNHKVSRALVNQYDVIVFEDLQIKNMVKSHSLAKSIHEVSWRQLIQFTTYKAENADKLVVFVNPHHTSQVCSSCGQIVKKSLADRWHECDCGCSMQRDQNAAINILNRGLQMIANDYK